MAAVRIKLMPGADQNMVVKDLQTVVGNLQNTYAVHEGLFRAYCQWANNTIRQLQNMIRPADLEAHVLTQRYWHLLVLASAEGTPVFTELLNMEVEERKQDFEETITDLKEAIRYWSRSGSLVMPDSSMFINHASKLADWDLPNDLDMKVDDVHILVPIIVVDELDRLKESGNQWTRWRAAHSLGVLDESLGSGMKWGILSPGDALVLRGDVTIEIVLDPPDHLRLSIPDDEIIDRGLAIQGRAARPVTLLTYDTGQATRARRAGLQVRKLSRPIGEEPVSRREGEERKARQTRL